MGELKLKGMKIYNGTPHKVCLYKDCDAVYNERHRKFFIKEGAQPCLVIPAGQPLSAKIRTERVGEVFVKSKVEGIDPLPSGYDFYIVSALYITAVKQLGGNVDRLLTVSQPVYDNPDNPRPVGCLGLELHCKVEFKEVIYTYEEPIEDTRDGVLNGLLEWRAEDGMTYPSSWLPGIYGYSTPEKWKSRKFNEIIEEKFGLPAEEVWSMAEEDPEILSQLREIDNHLNAELERLGTEVVAFVGVVDGEVHAVKVCEVVKEEG